MRALVIVIVAFSLAMIVSYCYVRLIFKGWDEDRILKEDEEQEAWIREYRKKNGKNR